MTDATEAARRILDARIPAQLSHRDAHIVARALLAGQDETVERCAKEAEGYARLSPYSAAHAIAVKIAHRIRALRSKP